MLCLCTTATDALSRTSLNFSAIVVSPVSAISMVCARPSSPVTDAFSWCDPPGTSVVRSGVVPTNLRSTNTDAPATSLSTISVGPAGGGAAGSGAAGSALRALGLRAAGVSAGGSGSAGFAAGGSGAGSVRATGAGSGFDVRLHHHRHADVGQGEHGDRRRADHQELARRRPNEAAGRDSSPTSPQSSAAQYTKGAVGTVTGPVFLEATTVGGAPTVRVQVAADGVPV